MRKILIIAAATLAISSVGAVLAQTSVDGLNLEAVEAKAKAHASDAADFVKGILDRQAHVSAEQTQQAQSIVQSANDQIARAAASAKPGGVSADGVDLDDLVAHAGQVVKPDDHSAPVFVAFASLSMPQDALSRLIADVSRAGGMVVFRGFSANGGGAFREGLAKAMPKDGMPHVGIDPRLFKAYHVEAVPTYVAASSSFELCSGPDCQTAPPPFDRITGNVTTHFALETMADGNGPGAPVAKAALKRLDGQE
ncbi:type-F conjugative transfer system pilin assembly protein TrbC [Novosphingobium terrae]|uniref:type-F conjugative transfer system pilin assembly protein TrbC n=1 Tax=Novosphingobium terrae TaxID=2726189 RepID=UPI00197D2AB6|nr:type-F conjugative transfer system pilin assembly protein TrbC [Novosphingobium terrae]